MFTFQTENLHRATIRTRVAHDGVPAAPAVFLAALASDPAVRRQLADALRAAPFDAFFWECAPVQRDVRSEGFEYVVISVPGLGRSGTDVEAFAEHFANAAGPTCDFDTLRRDARLIVPTPQPGTEIEAYAHLAVFLRGASDAQIDALLARVGAVATEWIQTRAEPLWLSTSGLGVAWLHVRFDSRPKYYGHTPYLSPAERAW